MRNFLRIGMTNKYLIEHLQLPHKWRNLARVNYADVPFDKNGVIAVINAITLRFRCVRMLVMYIEFVIADNFLLTYLAGSTATRLCHSGVRVLRILIAAAVGTGVAVVYPFLPDELGVTLAVKLSLWVVLCVIMYYKTSRATVAAMLFLGCTFAFGGASYAVMNAFFCGGGRTAAYMRECPVSIVAGTGALTYVACRFCIARLRVARVRAPYECGAEVQAFGDKLRFSAFMDTGNCVFDDRTGLPVIITDMGRFTDKLSCEATVGFAKSIAKLRKIRIKTAAGNAEIYVFRPVAITVYSDRQAHKINALIGLVCDGGERFSATHEMLLGPAAMASEANKSKR